MMDAYSDGICCDYGRGSFEVHVDGEQIYNGGSFQDQDTFEFDVSNTSGGPTAPSPTPPKPSPPTPINPPNCEQFKFQIKTDAWGDEVTWFLAERDDGPIKSGGNYESNSQYTDTECLPPGEYKFTIKDSQGDGICCQYGTGSYELFLDNTSIHKGGEFRRRERTYFQVADSSAQGRFSAMSFEGDTQQTKTTTPLQDPPCSQFELELKTDHRSDGISWQLEDFRNKAVFSGENYRDNQIYYFEECIPFANYTFIMHDRYGDGFYGYYGYGYYKLILNGKEIHEGKQFGFKDIVSFDSRTGEIDHHTTGIDH
jgi:pseudolysin/vibriolysin